MHVEARVTTMSDLEAVLALDVDAIGIGQEGCAAKLPDTESLRRGADRIRAIGREVTIVLPTAWQRSAERIAAAGLAVAGDGPVVLTANDMGTLLALADAAPKHVQLAAGSALTSVRAHASTDIPSEAGGAMLDTAGLLALSTHGVCTAEIDSAAAPGPELARWRFRRLWAATPVGWARSCPTARFYELAPPDCTHCCDEPITLTATQRWILNHGHREPLPIAERGRQPSLTVFGNAVYRSPAEADGDVAPPGPDLIVDIRFVPRSELPDRLATLRQATEKEESW